MKRIVCGTLTALVVLISTQAVLAQTELAPDQNPNYMISQAKYMATADSVNAFHSTTTQETYKAIDYLEDKKEAREERKMIRRQNRQDRYRYGGYNNYDYTPYGSYNNFYSPYNGYRYMNNYLWNTLPLALTLRYWHRH